MLHCHTILWQFSISQRWVGVLTDWLVLKRVVIHAKAGNDGSIDTALKDIWLSLSRWCWKSHQLKIGIPHFEKSQNLLLVGTLFTWKTSSLLSGYNPKTFSLWVALSTTISPKPALEHFTRNILLYWEHPLCGDVSSNIKICFLLGHFLPEKLARYFRGIIQKLFSLWVALSTTISPKPALEHFTRNILLHWKHPLCGEVS